MNELTLNLTPPRPAKSKVWVAYRTREDGLRLIRDKIVDWGELSGATLRRKDAGSLELTVYWFAWLKHLPKALNVVPSQLFSTKADLLDHLSKNLSLPSFGPTDPNQDEDALEPPIPVGTKVWTWFANGFNEEDPCGKIGEVAISDWLAEPPARVTKSNAGKVTWRAWVGDANGFSHPPHWLFPTKEALLEYLDRTAIDLTQ